MAETRINGLVRNPSFTRTATKLYHHHDKLFFNQLSNEWRTANHAGHDETSGIGNILMARMYHGY